MNTSILGTLRFTKRVVYQQSKNVIKLLKGNSLTTPSMGSMTLDLDDVRLAKNWLRREQDWYRFEEVEKYNFEFSQWNGSKYAFAFIGGRVALSACIYALGLNPGDEVIVPGYTCIVVPNAFHFAGVKSVYSDIELETYGLDAGQIESKINSNTKAILLQHLYGLVCRDYDALLDLAKRYNLKTIEDCAHSTGALYKGKKVGNFGDISFYSSEQSKVFNTIRGGVAVTNNDEFGLKLNEFFDAAKYPERDRIFRQLCTLNSNYLRFKHPQRWWTAEIAQMKYKEKTLPSTTDEEIKGIKPAHYGEKMPAAIAALGLNQLKKIDSYNRVRRENAKRWDSWCDDKGYPKPLVIKDSLPIYLRYPLLVEPEKKRNRSWAFYELGINPGIWFTTHLHPSKQPVFGCPKADRAVDQCINFPTLFG